MATERIVIVIQEQGTSQVVVKLNNVGRAARGAHDSVGLLQRTLGLFGAAATISGAVKLLDTYQTMQNRLKLVTKSQDELAFSTEMLFGVAERSRSSYEKTVELYARVALSTAQLGTTHAQAARIVETLNKAVIMSGATAREADAAIIQFSQGLASGRLAGQELRSVLEQMPAVADILAKKLGVTRGALRVMGAQGKISSQVMVDALLGAGEQIDREFQKTVPTISQSFVQLKNQLIKFAGELNTRFQIIPRISAMLNFFAANLDMIARVVIAGSFILSVTRALKVLTQLSAAFTASPLGLLAYAILAAVAALTAFSDQLKISANDSATLNDVMSTVFDDIGGVIKDWTKDLGDQIEWVGNLLTKVFGPDWEFSIKGFLKLWAAGVDGFVGFFIGVFGPSGVVASIWNNMGAAFEAVWKGILNGITAAFEAVVNGIIKGYNKIANTALGQKAGLVPELGVFKLDRYQYSQEAQDLGKTISDGMKKGMEYNGTQEYLDGVLIKADQRAVERIKQQEKTRKSKANGINDFNSPNLPDDSLKNNRQLEIDKIVDKLNAEAEAYKKVGFERLIANEMLQIENQLRTKGMTLTEAERATVTQAIVHNLTLQERSKILEEVDGALQQNARQQQILNDLIREGTGRTDLYKAKLIQLKIAQLEGNRDVASGFQRGFLKVGDEISNFAQMSEQTVTNAFHGMEDALVDFVKTGKLNFSGLVDSILSDLTRLLLRQALMGLLNSMSGGGGILGSIAGAFGGARAEGGPVAPGKAYLVGERGPEIFQPDHGGSIVPNGMAGAAAAPQVNVHVVNVTDPDEVAKSLNSSKNQDVVVNVIRNNRSAVKAALGIS